LLAIVRFDNAEALMSDNFKEIYKKMYLIDEEGE